MNELEALRSVAQILARVATPIERQNIARRVAQKTKGDDSEIALSLPHAAALFWPGDAEKTAEVLRQITLAFDAGELGGFLPREHRHILFTELTVWPDCPPMAADSPLRHWVPDAPAKPQAAPAPIVADSASNAPGNGKVWTPEKLAELKAYRATHTMPETATKFGISEQRIRQLLPSNKPKQKGYSAFTHRMK